MELKEVEVGGIKFLTRRPLFRELAKIGLLRQPFTPALTDVAIGDEPVEVTQQRASELLDVGVALENLMQAVCVKPRIVDDPNASVDGVETVGPEVLAYATEFFGKLIEAHFGGVKELDGFRQ